MEVKEMQLVEEEVITSVICDICGEEIPDIKYENYMTIFVRWGYTSFKDGDTWQAEICEKCVDSKLDKLIKFKKETRYA